MSQPQVTSPARSAAMQRVLEHIDENLGQPLTLEDLAQIAGLSIWRFATVFRQQVGISPHRYICRLRVEHARELMRSGLSAASAATEAGFYDQSHLSRHFKAFCGVTPGQFAATFRELAC
jgi:transcriptional regulator GlxA family with amidase domain